MSLFPINMEVKTPEESISGSFSDDGKVNAQPIYVKKELQEVLRDLKQNWSVHYYSKGAWSMHEMLEYLLQITGPADVSLTTWTASETPMRNIIRLIAGGQIRSLTALFDHRIDRRKPKTLQLAMGMNARIGLVKCHAKVLVITNENWAVSVVASANLTRNPRLEAGVICTGRDVAEFHKTWIENEYRASTTD